MNKKLLMTWVVIFIGLPFLAFSQNRQISGTVTDEQGAPLALVSLVQKGTDRGTTTNEKGVFSLSVVGTNPVLVVSFTGMQTQELVIGNGDNYAVKLKQNGQLSEVVVTTAFGVKQRKKTLGYNVQEVSSAELTKGKENSFINALQGKVSGVNITSSGGAAGSGTDIVIRGLSSISPLANNQPLIIIDGMPINNSTVVGNMLPSGGTNSNQAASADQFAFANRGLDINPDDIESVSVLKGAGATALYGLQAANGAIIITTKKGSAGKMSINFNSSYSVDVITKYPEIQTKYREGQQGRLAWNTDGSPNRFYTFGPLRTDADPVFYNFKNAFDHGARFNNSLTIQGGNAKTTYYSSVSALNQKGIVPASKYDRYSFKLAGTSQLSDKFSVNGSATVTSSLTLASSAGDKGFMTSLAYYSPTFDVRDYMYPDGSMKVFSPGVIDNPIYVAHYSQLKSNLFRTVGNMGFTWSILPKLKLDYKIGGDFYGDNRTRVVPGPRYKDDPTTLDLAGVSGGFVVEERVTSRDITSNAILTWQDKINDDFDYSVMAGNTLQNTYSDVSNARGEKFALPGFYDISNTANFFDSRATTRRKYAGIFGNVKFGFRNALYLELTGRNDWSSTLPKGNNSFFYPSASMSYVFTDMHHISNSILSYGKLRLSYARVGKDAPPYSIGTYYTPAPGFPFVSGTASVPAFLRSTIYGDPNLKPEMQNSFEIGTELRFLNNRLNLDVTYYKSKNSDQIINVPISYTSGYSTYITNAGSIQNKGVEIELNATPVKTKNLSWNIIGNWSRNRSKVLSIKEGIQEMPFYDEGRIASKLVVGGSAGDLYGMSYKRDAAGNLIIGANGIPTNTGTTFVKAGNAFPDWTASVTNSITWKQFTLSGLLEYKKGGDVYDVTMRNSIRNGVLKITETRYEKVVFKGVKESDGKPNDIPLYIDQLFYRDNNKFNNITDVILQDASWLRLRNLSFSYDISKTLAAKLKAVKGANLGVTMTNLILWTPYKGYDPSSSAFGAGYNVYGYTGSNIPNYSSWTLNLNVNF